MVEAIREVTDVPIRGDANEGYPDRETALKEIEWLALQSVDLHGQPLPAANRDDMAWLMERSPLPFIADEAFSGTKDLSDLVDAYHGINIKLAKSGGALAVLEAIEQARRYGLSVMLGSMIESPLGIAAAAHSAPLADYVDLDGNLLLANDPFDGHPILDGRIALGDEDGLGVHLFQETNAHQIRPSCEDRSSSSSARRISIDLRWQARPKDGSRELRESAWTPGSAAGC